VRIERERVTRRGFFPPWIRNEHKARYEFAARYCSGTTVVDCACGDGTFTRILASHARRVLAFDLAPQAINEARRVAPSNVDFRVADALCLPVDDESIDVFVSLETIEHLTDADSFLHEVLRLLKPDGVFICSTPNREVYSPGYEAQSAPWNPFHVREYNQEEFTRLLGNYFLNVELFGQNPRSIKITHLKGWLARFIGRKTVVRINQLLKLPRFLHDKIEYHRVVPCREDKRYEILVAVCSGPLKQGQGLMASTQSSRRPQSERARAGST